MLCSAYYGPRLCAFCIHTQTRPEDNINKGGVEGYLDVVLQADSQLCCTNVKVILQAHE